jgi:hypothetical protein
MAGFFLVFRGFIQRAAGAPRQPVLIQGVLALVEDLAESDVRPYFDPHRHQVAAQRFSKFIRRRLVSSVRKRIHLGGYESGNGAGGFHHLLTFPQSEGCATTPESE